MFGSRVAHPIHLLSQIMAECAMTKKPMRLSATLFVQATLLAGVKSQKSDFQRGVM